LLAEVAFLTPLVEFEHGPVQWVASARVCSAILVGAAAFLLLAGRTLGGVLNQGRRPGWPVAAAAVHLTLFAAFCWFTFRLAGRAGPLLTAWADTVGWGLLAAGVAWTAFLPFLPADFGVRVCRACPGFVLAAVALGAGFAVLSPWAQGLWLRCYRPVLALDQRLLERTYGQALAGTTAEGCPVLGTPRLLLLVTPQCSEMDALLVWGLLWAAAVWGRWAEFAKARMVLCLVGGAALLYGLIALRLYVLVVIGLHWSAQTCVSLAHSRVSGIGFLALTLGLLAGARWWCRRPLPRAAKGKQAAAALSEARGPGTNGSGWDGMGSTADFTSTRSSP
jgi:hypothetical protein